MYLRGFFRFQRNTCTSTIKVHRFRRSTYMRKIHRFQRSIQERSLKTTIVTYKKGLYNVSKKYRRGFYYGFKDKYPRGFHRFQLRIPKRLVSKDYRKRTYMFKRSIQDGSIGFKDVYQRGFCRFEKSVQ